MHREQKNEQLKTVQFLLLLLSEKRLFRSNGIKIAKHELGEGGN